MFNPCTDQKYKGIQHGCSGSYIGGCNCEFAKLKRDYKELEFRIRRELEPRLSAERQSYDRHAKNVENTEAQNG